MTSVLAQQLAGLAATQGPQPRYIRGKASLLYDYQTAADVGGETLLEIAQQGLEVLVRLDNRFKPFAQSLFSRSSLTVSRDQLTKEENQQLDRSLRAFLQLLSSHFLAPAAFQVLEYCIRRYKVNELNVDDLVLCALPFHATNEFVRLVQTLALKGTAWEWLTPMQASGASMPRSLLVTRCSTDPAVLSAICKAAEALGAPRCLSRTYLSFYAVAVCEMLMALAPNLPEEFLGRLMPFLVAGLKRNACQDYRAATLMILTQLCAVAQLRSKLLAVIVAEVCAGGSASDPRTPVMLLAHIALTQANCAQLHAAAVKDLAALPDVAAAICGLQKQGARMDPLLGLLLPALTAAAADSDSAAGLLCDLVHHVTLPGAPLAAAVEQLLLEGGQQYSAAQGGRGSDKSAVAAAQQAVARLQRVCRVLDLRKATELDAGINAVLQQGSEAGQDAAAAEGVFQFVQEACGAQHGMVNCAGQMATLAAAVGAPAAAMRVMALQQLDVLCAAPDAEEATVQLLVSGLLSGLADDSWAVAAAAAGADGLVHVPAKELLPALQQLLARAAAAVVAPAAEPQHKQEDGRKKDVTKAAKRSLQAAVQLGQRDAAVADAAAALVLDHLLVTRKMRKLARAALEAASSMSYHPFMAALASQAAADPVLGAADGLVAATAADAAKQRKGKGKKQQAEPQQPPAAVVDDEQHNAHLAKCVAAVLHSGDEAQLQPLLAVAAAAGPLGKHLLVLALCCHGDAAGASAAAGSKRSKKDTEVSADGAAALVLAQLALQLAVPRHAAAAQAADAAAGPSLASTAVLDAAALLDIEGLPGPQHQQLLQSGCWRQQQPALLLVAVQQQLRDLPAAAWQQAVPSLALLFREVVAAAGSSSKSSDAASQQPTVLGVLHLLVDKALPADGHFTTVGFLSELYGLPVDVAGAPVQVAALQVLTAAFESAAASHQLPAGAAASPAWLLRLLAAAASEDAAVRSASVAAAAAAAAACHASAKSPAAGSEVSAGQLQPLLQALVSSKQLVQRNSSTVRLLLQRVLADQQEHSSKSSKGKAATGKVALPDDLTAQLPQLRAMLSQLLCRQLPSLCSPADLIAAQLAAAALASGAAAGAVTQQQAVQAAEPALQQLLQLLLGGGVHIASAAPAIWEQLSLSSQAAAVQMLTAATVAAAQHLLGSFSEAGLQATPAAVELLCQLVCAGHAIQGFAAAATAEGLAVAAAVRAAAVALVTPSLYAGLTLAHQEQLLRGLVLMSAADGDQSCREAARRALEQLPLTADVLQLPLQRLQLGFTGSAGAAAAAAAPTPSKRRRTAKAAEQPSAAAAASPLQPSDVALATAVLELLQWSTSVKHPEQLVPVLQQLLRTSLPLLGSIVEHHAGDAPATGPSLLPPELQDAADADDADAAAAATSPAPAAVSPATLGYAAQLVLQVLQQLAVQLPKGSQVPGGGFDVPLVLETARSAPDAAVRNAALSLWGALAARSPGDMLGHVLQALTLIHQSAAVYDDAHSHRVTSDTLAALVPAWLAAGRSSQQLWEVLVEALPSLPAHRRAGLLQALLGHLSEDQGLWVVLLLLLRKAEAGAAAPAADDAANPADGGEGVWLQLAGALCEKVSPVERLYAFGRVLPGCLQDPPAAPHGALPRLVVAFVTRQLQEKTLLGAAAASCGAPAPPEVQASCAAVLEQAVLQLQLLHPTAAAAASSSATSPKAAKKVQRAVKAATSGLYDLLKALSALIDASAYLRVLVQLVASSSEGRSKEKVVKKALQLLADRLNRVQLDLVDIEALPAGERVAAEAKLVDAALQLLDLGPRLLDPAATPSPLTRQQALLAMQGAVAAFGGQQPDRLLPALPVVLAAVQDAVPAVRGSALACMAALVAALDKQLIGQLPAVATAVLAAAEATCAALAASAKPASGSSDDSDDEAAAAEAGQAALELTAALAALEALVRCLGGFLSPYLPRLLKLLVHPSVLGCATAAAAATAAQLQAVLPSAVPSRLLLEPLAAQWEYAVGLSVPDAALAAAKGVRQPAAVLLGILTQMVSAMDFKQAGAYHEAVFALLLKALDTRRRWMLACSSGSEGAPGPAAAGLEAMGPVGAHQVESAAAGALVALVMKLSENRFKPLFLRLLDWAASSLGAAVAAAQTAAEGGEEAAAAGDGGLGRTVALLAAVVALSHRLRAVLVPYYKYILDLLLTQLTGDAAAAAGVRPAKKKRRKSAAAGGEAASSSSREVAMQLGVWLARSHAVRALHLLFLHDTASEQQQRQEQLEKVLQPLVDTLAQDGPGEAAAGEQLLPLLASQCADAELDVHGGPTAALGEAGAAAVAATGAPLPGTVTDVVGLAAVGSLLAAALWGHSDLTWKPVHHAVLLATRRGGLRAKLLSLGLLSRLVGRLQEEYLVLLPEALPFIAELLEDSDARVEGAVQGLVAQLEAVSGESLQQYLKV